MNIVTILLGIEARRPASWLLCLAAIGGVSVATGRSVGGLPQVAIGFLLGGLLTVASLAVPAPTPAGHPGGAAAAVAAGVARIGWPVIGGIVGAMVGRHGPSMPTLVGFLGGAGFAAVVSAILARPVTNRADQASGALAITAGAGLAGAVGWSRFPFDPWTGIAATVVAGLAAIAAAAIVARMPLSARKPRGTGRLIASGEPTRGRLDLVGMAAALTGMVVCLFLAPESAAANRLVTVACFVALAVPEMTISPVALDRGWRRLLDSVALRPANGGERLGMTDLVTESVGFHALLLGWPSLVALALLAGDRERSAGAVATVVALAVTAAVSWGVASLVGRRTDGGTALATVVAVLVAVWMVSASYVPA